MSKDNALYGITRPNTSKVREISSSTSLAFTSQLSSLLSSSASRTPSSGRSRPQKKDDIFTTHNKNTKKRALKDLEDDDPGFEARGGKKQNLGDLDEGAWKRTKRKMEEKARLYSAMKRGDYVAPTRGEDGFGNHGMEDERGALIDFDRKWAETESKKVAGEKTYESSEGESDLDRADSDVEEVEYEDEFGRLRKGTRAEAAREERRKHTAAKWVEEADSMSVRPSVPSNIIYGNTIQSSSFNPDEPIAAKMADLAAKRDKSATPPPEKHYDAKAEIRTKGVGFYGFSGDREERREQMEALERERKETEKGQAERKERLEKRKAEIEARRKLVRAKKGEKQADRFLEELGGNLESRITHSPRVLEDSI